LPRFAGWPPGITNDRVEELEEVFKSAHDLIMSTMPQSGPKESKKKQRIIIEEEEKGLEIVKTGSDFSEYAV
jgi:hypothetical protein